MIAPASVLPNIYIFWGNFMASLLPSTCRSPAPLKWHTLPCRSGRLQRLPPPDGGPSPALLGVRTSEQLSLHPGSGASNPAMHGQAVLPSQHLWLQQVPEATHSGPRSQANAVIPVSRSRDLWRSPERDGQPCHGDWGPARHLAGICLPPLSSLSPRRPALAASLEQKTQVYGSHVTVSSTLGPPGASRPESIQGAGEWHSSAQTPTLTTKSTGRWPYRTRPRVSVLGTEGMRRADFLLPPKTQPTPTIPSEPRPGKLMSFSGSSSLTRSLLRQVRTDLASGQ